MSRRLGIDKVPKRTHIYFLLDTTGSMQERKQIYLTLGIIA